MGILSRSFIIASILALSITELVFAAEKASKRNRGRRSKRRSNPQTGESSNLPGDDMVETPGSSNSERPYDDFEGPYPETAKNNVGSLEDPSAGPAVSDVEVAAGGVKESDILELPSDESSGDGQDVVGLKLSEELQKEAVDAGAERDYTQYHDDLYEAATDSGNLTPVSRMSTFTTNTPSDSLSEEDLDVNGDTFDDTSEVTPDYKFFLSDFECEDKDEKVATGCPGITEIIPYLEHRLEGKKTGGKKDKGIVGAPSSPPDDSEDKLPKTGVVEESASRRFFTTDIKYALLASGIAFGLIAIFGLMKRMKQKSRRILPFLGASADQDKEGHVVDDAAAQQNIFEPNEAHAALGAN